MSTISKSTVNEVVDEVNSSNTVMSLAENVTFPFILNDPSTPDLIAQVNFPNTPDYPKFSVVGFNGPSGQLWSDDWRSAQCHAVVCYGLNTFQPAFQQPIKRWPGTGSLTVVPKAGQDLNAYYDRRHLKFFYFDHPRTKKRIYTADSVDIVAHELGHAFLDSIRPDLWNINAIEVWSFHEAWADMSAIFTLMKHDAVLSAALKEDNDFFGSNVISRLAEQMGDAIYDITGGRGGRRPGALRNANNKFKYVVPERLPQNAPDDKLACECHSFGRVFLGAYFEFLTKVFKWEVEHGADRLETLRNIRTFGAKLMARSAQIAPATPRFYDAVARMMLKVEAQMGGKYQSILKETMQDRNILSKRTVKAMSTTKLSDLDLKDVDLLVEQDDKTIVKLRNTKLVQLSNHFGVRAQSNNPLYNCHVEIPLETYMEFDNETGVMTDSIAVSEKVAIDSARACINYLHQNDLVGDNESQPFYISANRLTRKYFS